MSTFLHTKSASKKLRSVDNLKDYFQKHAKQKGKGLVGIECELFGVHEKTGKSLPYFGPAGIEAVLNFLAYEFGYQKIIENKHTIALHKDDFLISLEPGGQVELSASPVKTIHQAKAQLDEFFFQLRLTSRFIPGISWMSAGVQPFSRLEEIEWVPKKRYQIMGKYLGRKGRRAHDMMKRTCGNQVNLDYFGECDAIQKMRLALLITPVVSAMFANSPLAYGKLNGYETERLQIWRYTDPERGGLELKLICDSCTFDDYLNYVLDIPMMFFVRGDRWIQPQAMSFRKFLEKGYQGVHATEEDFQLHLSTIFTDVRFKQYIEIRGMDAQRGHLIPSVFAFWKGLFYDEEAIRKSLKLMERFDEKSILKLHRDVEKKGLSSRIRNVSTLELARELTRFSEEGLKRQKAFNEQEEDERIYLEPLKNEILREGKSPAKRLQELWKSTFKNNPHLVVDFLKI